MNASRHEEFVVEQTLPAVRLDHFLRDRFGEVSRGTFQRLIGEGHIRVNGIVVKPTHHPRAGERITIHWPPPKSTEVLPEDIPLDVMFEDDDLLVLNKAPGLVVHPASGNEEHTLVNALLHHCAGQLSGIGGVERPGIVHRLDKETSGCLVVAKNDRTHLALSRQFMSRSVEKIYQALVCGTIAKASGDIKAAIARHPSHRKRMAVSDDRGRAAWTSYRILGRLHGATRVEALLHTGRTHQIRVHFLHLGHPLVGDATYGARQNARLKEVTGYAAPRVMLHAEQLSFTHPATEEPLTFRAALPEDFRAAVAALKVEG